MCKRVDKTKSYINIFSAHWKIEGRWSCGIAFCGNTNNAYGCKGGKCCWGISIAIHRGASDGKSTTKGDGDGEAWKTITKGRRTILDKVTLLEKGIKILDLDQFMWTQTKQNYDKHVEQMEN